MAWCCATTLCTHASTQSASARMHARIAWARRRHAAVSCPYRVAHPWPRHRSPLASPSPAVRVRARCCRRTLWCHREESCLSWACCRPCWSVLSLCRTSSACSSPYNACTSNRCLLTSCARLRLAGSCWSLFLPASTPRKSPRTGGKPQALPFPTAIGNGYATTPSGCCQCA